MKKIFKGNIMDDELKRKISIGIGAVSALVLIVSLIGNYTVTKDIEEDFLAVDRSPLQAFRLIDYKEESNGVFIDVVSLNNGKKYENNFISRTCPNGKDKKPGLIMHLSVVENLKTSTNETFYTLDRAYEYLCTNLNMKEEDDKLFNRIKEARDRAQADAGIVIKNK
jgi:hypothetical protein